MIKNIAITGVSGFIGKTLVGLLKRDSNYKIFCLSYTKNNYADLPKDIDICIHLGSFTPKFGKQANYINENNQNIISTFKLIEMLPTPPEKFIYISTIDVYGKLNDNCNENYKPNPITLYGWSKLYCEEMLKRYAEQHEINFQILRVGHVYGKGEDAYKKLIPATIENIKNGKNPIIYGTGNEKRSFIHVDDICEMIIKALELSENVGPINLCGANSYSVKQIVSNLINISQKKLEIVYEDVSNIGNDSIFDVAKMHKYLGKETILLEEGLFDEYYS